MVRATSAKVFTKQKLKQKIASQHPQEKTIHPTLKELDAKVYPFLDFEVPAIVEELLAKEAIELPMLK